eukprot:TRINITY_DN10956_c0_g1_i1.p1 TRINITY_DN10956_c0_g1~~TRINITY_DN10956_c0_g1_i1.p1  ORF type:complete len:196 (+),score=12.59 TRINITY_DN10956_c0_g1_i1:545-1132(+)
MGAVDSHRTRRTRSNMSPSNPTVATFASGPKQSMTIPLIDLTSVDDDSETSARFSRGKSKPSKKSKKPKSEANTPRKESRRTKKAKSLFVSSQTCVVCAKDFNERKILKWCANQRNCGVLSVVSADAEHFPTRLALVVVAASIQSVSRSADYTASCLQECVGGVLHVSNNLNRKELYSLESRSLKKPPPLAVNAD